MIGNTEAEPYNKEKYQRSGSTLHLSIPSPFVHRPFPFVRSAAVCEIYKNTFLLIELLGLRLSSSVCFNLIARARVLPSNWNLIINGY